MRSSNFFATAPLADLRMLRKATVLDLVGLSERHIRNLENAGDFPSRVVLGDNAVAWIEREVRDWLAARAKRAAVKPQGAAVPARAAAKRGRA